MPRDRKIRVNPGESFVLVSDGDSVRMWCDHTGKIWRQPECVGKLHASKIPSHAALRAFVLARDGSCKWCGRTDDLIADHIISIRNGGDHHPSNLQALCQSCNSRKASVVDARAKKTGVLHDAMG